MHTYKNVYVCLCSLWSARKKTHQEETLANCRIECWGCPPGSNLNQASGHQNVTITPPWGQRLFATLQKNPCPHPRHCSQCDQALTVCFLQGSIDGAWAPTRLWASCRAPPTVWQDPPTLTCRSGQAPYSMSVCVCVCPRITVIYLNSRREFNYYLKSSILFIIEELWAWLKVTAFALITGSSPFWLFYASQTERQQNQ